LTQTAAVPAYCRNCSLFLGVHPGNFCPHCGQDTAAHPPSAWEFLHEFISHYVALEGKLARSLGLLFFRPGELTRRYLEGRKNSYVLPLRLYLTASIVFFLLVKILGAGSTNKIDPETQVENKFFSISDQAPERAKGVKVGKAGPPVVVGGVDQAALDKPLLDSFGCELTSTWCTDLKTFLKDKYHDKSAKEVVRQIFDRAISLAPYAMFLFLPVFALMTKLLYLGRKLFYGEHLVYAFHVHAFTYLMLLLVALSSKAVGDWLYLAGAIYFWLAMRRVFGGGWWATSWRYVFIGIAYPILLLLVIVLTLIAAVFV